MTRHDYPPARLPNRAVAPLGHLKTPPIALSRLAGILLACALIQSAQAATCGTVLAYLGYLWLHRAFLRDHIPLAGRVLRRATLLTALPVTLLVSYAYLRDHDFFSQRPGSYPVYQSELGSSVLFNSQIKPIKNFFSIDKNEQ